MAFNVSYVYIAKDKFTAVANRISRTATKMRKKFSGIAVQAGKTGLSIDNLGQKLAAFAALAATLAIFAAPIKNAIAFESQLADLNKVLEFELPTGLDKTARGLEELSRTMPVAIEGLLDIAVAGGQLGLTENDIIPFTKSIAKMSVAFGTAQQQTATSMAIMSNLFRIPVDGMQEIGDAMNVLSNTTVTTADALLRSMANKGAAAGAAMGLTALESIGLSNAIQEIGVKAERTGSMMSAMARSLLDVSIMGPKFVEDFINNPKESLIKLLQQINKLEGAQKSAVTQEAFGEFGIRVGQLAGTMETILIPTMEKATNTVAALGSVQEEFAIRAGTTDSKLITLGNNFGILSRRIGDTLLPIVNAVGTGLFHLATFLTWVMEATGPLIPALFTMGAVMAFLAGAATILGIAVTWPFLLIAGGIAAAIVGIGWLVDKVGGLEGMINVFKMIGNAVIDFVLAPISLLNSAVDSLLGTDFSGSLEGLKNDLKFSITAPSADALSPVTNKTESEMNINLNAPPGVIKSVETKTTGNIRTNVGQNMANWMVPNGA